MSTDRGTDEEERTEEVEDQFRSLMEGLRTSIPGAMVLFSFLLILPLQSEFTEIRTRDTVIYYIAFGSAALSAVLLIAPSVHQRMRAPFSGIKRRTMSHVMYGAKVAIAGTVTFAVAISATVYMVSAIVFSDPLAVLATVVIAATAAWAWFYLPLIRFNQLH